MFVNGVDEREVVDFVTNCKDNKSANTNSIDLYVNCENGHQIKARSPWMLQVQWNTARVISDGDQTLCHWVASQWLIQGGGQT